MMNPLIIKVGLISFFADLSSELLYPITPIFLTSILGASMTSLGVIEGIAEFVASILKARIGMQSDKIGKRVPFIWSGYFISTLSKASIGLATSWLGVLFGRVLDRVGKGIRTAPRDALISESVPSEQLGLAFGVHRAMDTMGAVLGPVVALLLLKYWAGDHLRSFYFLSVIPGFIGVFLAFKLPETLKAIKKECAPVSIRLLPKSYFKFLFAWGVFMLANSSDAFLIIKTKQMGYSLSQTILMYCFFNLVYAISSPFLGKWSDQFGKQKILILSLLVFALVYFGFALSINPWFLFASYGLFMGMSEGIGKARIAELIPLAQRSALGATAQGFFGMTSGIAALLASIIAGLLWDHVGTAAPFIFGGTGAIIALFVFLLG